MSRKVNMDRFQLPDENPMRRDDLEVEDEGERCDECGKPLDKCDCEKEEHV